MTHQMVKTYHETVEDSVLKRTLFEVIQHQIPEKKLTVSHYEIIPTAHQLCIRNYQTTQKYCYRKARLHTH
ncbi:hypothetical protein B4W74_01940 [Staphylococcus intermedius]|nr:hypothetical protein B5C04_01925 [Staphylococcus intermedius]PNZ53286.1 hypothetical protein CD138_05025 [Staphylococcus intermedius NCTC 11048]PCF81400.1 hypothetical protein B4W74_01940 [Staphylococcus intermedius]PCF82681.1 hypothetical protein B4W70_01925 [Staphylococcus intermedius]PCF88637.1 hypothetical protein B4W75_04970 [Staphylococcus intermedius]